MRAAIDRWGRRDPALSDLATIDAPADAVPTLVLCGATDIAHELGGMAEQLLARGGEVELVVGVERAPARLVEAVQRHRGAAVFVLCRRGERPNPNALKALFDETSAPCHRWIDVDLREGTVVPTRIDAAFAELKGVDMFAGLPQAPAHAELAPTTEVSGVVTLVDPSLLGTPRDAPSPRRRRLAIVLAALALASTAVLIAVRDRAPVEAAAIEVVEPPLPVAALPVVPPELAPIAPPIPVPVIVAAPVPAPVVPAGDSRTQLDLAIEQRKVAVHRGLVVAEPILGERPWHDAMTTCRGRPFHFTRGWRVATKKELVWLAKAGLLPEAPVWSSTRGDRKAATSFVVEGHDGTTSTVPREESAAVTVCVKRR